jgi:tRNA pseudouridine32 synthase/23S rRNA pseudouridine746 synthase
VSTPALPPWIYTPPTDPWLEVLHADRDFVVIDKPSGLFSVPGRGPELLDSAQIRVATKYGAAYAAHRLDLDTSGLLVIALRRKAEAELHRQFREHLVEKVYVARVGGSPAEDGGLIDLPLLQEEGAPLSRVDPAGKPARTAWRVLSRGDGTTLVELRPQTGRSHQLRLHLRAIGHPILGDRFYGAPEHAAPRLMLHAAELSLLHPYRGERMTFRAAVPFV